MELITTRDRYRDRIKVSDDVMLGLFRNGKIGDCLEVGAVFEIGGFRVRIEDRLPYQHIWVLEAIKSGEDAEVGNNKHKTTKLTFGEALEAAKRGRKIAREGWNGKNQYVFLVKGSRLEDAVCVYIDEHHTITTDALAIRTTSGAVQVGWLASQSDMLSSDWKIVD